MLKNILSFIIFFILGIIIVVVVYLWAAPRYSQVPKPYFPKTLFSIENAPKDSLTGEVANISGNVTWLSRSSDLGKVISSTTTIQQGEEVDALGDGQADVNFPNTVKVSLKSNTQVSFIQTLPINFVVDQGKGIATYQKTGNNAVSVRALDLLTNIESGAVTLYVDPDSATIEITVNTGSVTVAFNDTDNLTNIVTLKAGDKYLFNNNTKTGEIE